MNWTNEMVECHECGTRKFRSRMYATEVYDSPFDEGSDTVYHCKRMPKSFKDQFSYHWREDCLELLEDTSWADFRYFLCPHCVRMVCRQNPRNGWHVQSRVLNDEEVCLRCYEEHILEHGVDREDLEDGKLPGMFFSSDNHELTEAGYEKVVTQFIRGSDAAMRLCDWAIKLIDEGQKVVIGYESMAIGGSEGTVTLFAKEAS